VVGVAGVGLFAGLGYFFYRRKRADATSASNSPNSSLHSDGFGGPGGAGGGAMIQRDQSNATTLAALYDEKNLVPIVDQRLDPGKVFMRWDQNDSRRSLQDEHDYSRRVLRVTNPSDARDSIDD
jgi:hypothetical protein